MESTLMRKNMYVLAIAAAVAVFAGLNILYQQTRHEHLQMVPDKSSLGSKDDPNGRRTYQFKMLRNPLTGAIPRGIRQREMEYAQTLPTREQINGLAKTPGMQSATWVPRGPWNVGGRTRALGVDRNNPSIIIAGGVSGGMWRSTNGGTSWTKTTVPAGLHSVTCLVQDPRSGQTNTWYYGSGEFQGNSAASPGGPYSGDGIFKSTDNGLTWTVLASTSTGQPHRFDNFFDYVWNIVVQPNTGNVFAATYGAIFRSTNGGTNWSSVLGGASPFSRFTDITVDANGVLYATGSSEGSMAGIFRSTTGASGSWTNITPNNIPNTFNRIVGAVAPSNPTLVYFIAETPNAGTLGHKLYRYNSTSNSYSDRSANLPAFGQPVGDFDSQGSYDLLISVKPDNENVVLIGGTNLYRSIDGFATTVNTTWIGGYATANDISQYSNHHPDLHANVWHPTNPLVLFSGHDGGVSRTDNILAPTVSWQFLNNGYLTTQCYTVAMDKGTNASVDIISGFQDNGCWGVSAAPTNATWNSLFGGDGAFTAISNGGASIYVSSQNGRTYRLFGSNQFARVDPQGGSDYLFINPFILDPNNTNLMYFAGGTSVWRNSNVTQIPAGSNNPASVNWTRLQNSSVGNSQVSALAASKSSPTNRLYIGHSEGFVIRVDNANTGDPAGVNITPPGVAQGSYVSGIAVDPNDGNKVLVIYSNYGIVSLYYSTNGGTSWTDVEGNLAGTIVGGSSNGPSCRYAQIVPVSGGGFVCYLGTSTGLYSTTTFNGSSTVWAQEGATTIGNVVVTFVDSRPSDGAVVVGTHANGAYSTGGGGGGGGGTTVNVYPGDANNDGTCDIRDILPIGRFFGSTGPNRSGGSNTWSAQSATVWTTVDATYADCNGNGSVEGTDIQAIIDNYGRNRGSLDQPPYDKMQLCTDMLREIDRQPDQSEGMREIRKAIINYMKQQLGVTFDYALAQNYPNPFNPSTTIRFTVPEPVPSASIRIYNTAGQLVWSKILTAVETGNHEITWNGKTLAGVQASSGMYIYRLSAGNFSASKRMLMIK